MSNKTRRTQFFLTLLLFSCLIPALYAEDDNGRFLPSAPFQVKNLYFSLEPQLRTPLQYFTNRSNSMSSVGFGGIFEFGYNWDGWLFSIQAGDGWFGTKETGSVSLNSFNQILVGAGITRAITNATIPGLPYWFGFAPKISAGLYILQSNYMQPDNNNEENLLLKQTGYCAYTDISLYLLFPVHKAVTPYVGYVNTLQFVSGGLVYSGAVSLGVRLYPFAFTPKGKKADSQN